MTKVHGHIHTLSQKHAVKTKQQHLLLLLGCIAHHIVQHKHILKKSLKFLLKNIENLQT